MILGDGRPEQVVVLNLNHINLLILIVLGHSMLNRRRVLVSGATALVLPSITQAAPIVQATRRLVVFGDSYSDTNYYDKNYSKLPNIPNWSELLVSRGRALRQRNLALEGASALQYRSNPPVRSTFQSQVDLFLQNPNWGLDDVTVVYLGYNDIARSGDLRWVNLQQAQLDYAAGVLRLLRAGAKNGKRRLVLTTIHDWSKTPSAKIEWVTRTRDWQRFTYNLIAKHPGIINANLNARFADILQRPQFYGLTNVTSADPVRASSTALYLNGNHFGAKGQQLLADEFGRVLDFVIRTR